MATTILPSNLTITVTESVQLGGKNYGGTNIMQVADIAEIYKRIVTVPNGSAIDIIETTAGSASTVSNALFDVTKIKYVRITNLMQASGEGIQLQFSRDDASDGSDEETFWYLLEEGKSFILHTFDQAFDANDGALASPTLDQISVVRAITEAAATADLEIFIASIA